MARITNIRWAVLQINPLLPAIAVAILLLFLPYLYQIRMTTRILRFDQYACWLFGFGCWCVVAEKWRINLDKESILYITLFFVLVIMTAMTLPDDAGLFSLISIVSFTGIFLFYKRYFRKKTLTKFIICITPTFVGQLISGWRSAGMNKFAADSVTGAFLNSGYYANFILPVVPICFVIALIGKHSNIYLRVIYMFLFFAAVGIILITGSRSALLGLFIGLITVWNRQIKLSWMRIRNLYKLIFVCLFTFLFITVSYKLFQYKEGSALGRLTIYRVSWNIVKDYPWFGVGPGRFPAVYNEYQSTFFSGYNVSVDIQQLATNTFEAFNIILQVIVEYGLIVFVFLILIISVSMRKLRSVMNSRGEIDILQGSIGGLVALNVAALFSNPFHATPTLLLTVVIGANAMSFKREAGKPIIRIGRYRLLRYCIIIISGTLLGNYVYRRLDAEIKWKQAADYAAVDQFDMAAKLYELCMPTMMNDGCFLYSYGETNVLSGHPYYAAYLLRRSLRFYSTVNSHIYLGDCYWELKLFSEAEQEYKKAIYMVPSHFYARWQLIKLYRSLGDFVKLKRWAWESLSRPVKINSEATMAIIDSIYATTVAYPGTSYK